MVIDFSKLDFDFSQKPLLIGGKAMEYYGLRKSGNDIDFVISKADIEALAKKYPHNLKDLWGDFGVAIDKFEFWKTIHYFDYDQLKIDAVVEDNFLVIDIEKLLLQKAMAMEKEKYRKDFKLVLNYITNSQGEKFDRIKTENLEIVSQIGEVSYVERTDPGPIS